MSDLTMIKYGTEITIVSVWLTIMLILYPLLGVGWFQLGDFDWRAAMAYHGVLVPVWMMLVLAYARHIKNSLFSRKLLGIAAVSASILTGIGSALIHSKGISAGMLIQVSGMTIAEVTAIVVIIQSLRQHFKTSESTLNTTAWWTVSIGLMGMVLATPLGHIAGTASDLEHQPPIFEEHVAMLGLKPEAVIDGYIGSHSHQIVAAFFAAGFALPLIRKSFGKSRLSYYLEMLGLIIIATATIAQVALYQYCAWFGWEPPDLFASGPNGLPLDDFILVILGLGILFLIPALLTKYNRAPDSEDYSRFTSVFVAMLIVAYMISVIALGLYIEFHEQVFGHGEGNAPGTVNDMAYIRSHLLFGFMIIPVLLTILLNTYSLKVKGWDLLMGAFITLAAVAGLVGEFSWTFMLNASWVELSNVFTVIVLLVFVLRRTFLSRIVRMYE